MARTDARPVPTNKQTQSFRATLGSVTNTYSSTTISTGITPAGGFGLRILDVNITQQAADQAPLAVSAALATGGAYSIQVTKDVQTAMLSMTDQRILAAAFVAVSGDGLAAATVASIELPLELWLPQEEIIVTPNLYVGSKTNAATLTAKFDIIIQYETVQMSELEILRILNG